MNLELEKKKLEKKKVAVAADEKQVKIYERMAEIDRLKNEIEIQNKRVEELDKEILGMQKGNE